eukprot:90283_1
MTQVIPESTELYNNEVDDIVYEIRGTVNNSKMTQSERDARVSVLLAEMEQYTQPLIEQIDEIKSVQNVPNINITNEQQVRPSILQEESDQVFGKVLARLGYDDLDELTRHSKTSQIFGECVKDDLQRKESEKATSSKVDKQLKQWKQQKEKNEHKTIQKFKAKKTKADKPNKNNAKKVMMMIGVEDIENEEDMEAICNASSKALRKLV